MNVPTNLIPVPFGKYLLLDRVNVGGMAEVWRGKMFGAAGFERTVAIKRILPNIAQDEEFIAMFKDEAKITVQLTHANIAQVYEFDEVTIGSGAKNYYIAMEYVSGRDLRAIFDRCRKKGEPAPVQLACFVVAKLCEGLDYAHRKKDGLGRDMNVVHRDVSPQNVLISYEGEVKIIDFGIAKAAGKATKTQAGIIKGKFAYMSPEQIRGLPLDRRSDVFAIGVCLWEILAGERLFVGESDFAVLEKVRKAEVPPPSRYNRRVPEALDRIVLKALAKDVDARFQYASDLGDELQRFLITRDSIFSRKDLMQYMKSTFAEELEREKVRLQGYAQVRSGDMPEAVENGTWQAPMPLVGSQGISRSGAVLPIAGPPVLAAAESETVDGETLVYDRNSGSRRRASSTPPPTEHSRGSGAGRAESASFVPGSVAQVDRAGEHPVPIVDDSPQSSPEASRPARRSSGRLAVGIVAALIAVAAVGAAVWIKFLSPDHGVLYVEVPEELRGKARVNLDGRDLGPAQSLEWPLVRRMVAGPRTLIITAEGWKPFTTTVEVKADKAITEIRPRLRREVELAQLVLGLDPVEAEVRIDGRTVKKLGDPRAPYIGEIVVGKASTLEVRMAGYKVFAQTVTAGNGEEPVRLNAELEPAEFLIRVTSDPPGAQIRVAGRDVGKTPAEITVPPDTTELALAKKCFDELVVPVKLPAEPGKRLHVPGKLARRPRCR